VRTVSWVGMASKLVARRPRAEGRGTDSSLCSVVGTLAAASASTALEANCGTQQHPKDPAALSSTRCSRAGCLVSGESVCHTARNQAPKSRDAEAAEAWVTAAAVLLVSWSASLACRGGHQLPEDSGIVSTGTRTGVEVGHGDAEALAGLALAAHDDMGLRKRARPGEVRTRLASAGVAGPPASRSQ